MIPKDIREALDFAVSMAYDGLCADLARHSADFARAAELSADIDSIFAARRWLDSQPQMPQPDWSEAPEWAICHVFWPHGIGSWLSEIPTLQDKNLLGVGWRASNACKEQRSELPLPLGCDWRTTLQRKEDA